jgi:hypothetical protein
VRVQWEPDDQLNRQDGFIVDRVTRLVEWFTFGQFFKNYWKCAAQIFELLFLTVIVTCILFLKKSGFG